jgi:hypothetical protein
MATAYEDTEVRRNNLERKQRGTVGMLTTPARKMI